jgi:sugar phosphate isomerase/epimerase
MERLGFRLSGFRKWSLEKSLKTLAKIGYKSVELCLEHPELDPAALTDEKIAAALDLLKKHNLRLSSISYHGKTDDLATIFRKQKEALAVAQKFNSRVLVVGTPPTSTDPQGCSSFQALEDLLKAADGTGVVVAAEPEPDTVLNGMYEFSLLASHMAGSPLGLNLNLANATLTEGDAAAVIEEWSSFIVHTHVCDARKNHSGRYLPGDGHLDLRRLVRKLQEHNYWGDLTIDLTEIEDAPQDWAQQALERCKEILA